MKIRATDLPDATKQRFRKPNASCRHCSVHSGERTEIFVHRDRPEIRIVKNIMPYIAGHIELEEVPLKGFSEKYLAMTTLDCEFIARLGSRRSPKR